MTTLEQIANDYCRLVAVWGFQYRPERMPYLYSGREFQYPDEKSITGKIHEGTLGFVAPGDVCDDNIAMEEAFKRHGVEVFNPNGPKLGDVIDQWNAAWYIAVNNRFLPKAGGAAGQFMVVWFQGYDERIQQGEFDLDFFSADRGFTDDDVDKIARLGEHEMVILSDCTTQCAVVNMGVKT